MKIGSSDFRRAFKSVKHILELPKENEITQILPLLTFFLFAI